MHPDGDSETGAVDEAGADHRLEGRRTGPPMAPGYLKIAREAVDNPSVASVTNGKTMPDTTALEEGPRERSGQRGWKQRDSCR